MKTVLNVKVDIKTKREAQKVAQDIGIPMSFVINHYLKYFIAQKQITLQSYPMSKKLERRLARIEKDTAENKNMSPIFPSMDKAIAYLHSQVPKKRK